MWIGLHEPEPEEFEAVRAEFGLHELAVEDAVNAHQRPKLEVYDEDLFVVLKTARYDDVARPSSSRSSSSSSGRTTSSPSVTAQASALAEVRAHRSSAT